MRNKYRIVLDIYGWYTLQTRKWWFPVWLSYERIFKTIESAERFAAIKSGAVVKEFYIEDLNHDY